ncbi:hypothetical protein BATDEDRAFT_27481 [Batrachochytrium dendrobatidis JAM81]|uniref:C2H2-type domain-containing protein n=1 Tax=Batrachochytrium dendrobatidis (strain JAM81 / FGSC 10211) TaxID=684364 RepID=F4PAZ9_BATDJ|nr:uncharacterized protein BATDEDRAFT_27481 [Batrachochytrium dendrobatidis JAM81]EGF77636.1 hypothetical protein BATDEDRAFT_27481 [Batrachochytrium dendrobatidis JAM81]|eukprot:XP_006681685.1 hypothetical protein BATDEDRAFT_27481 [Batrachochytrium dendrobatidis JAM81]
MYPRIMCSRLVQENNPGMQLLFLASLFSVPFSVNTTDALERDLKRERARQDTCTVSLISLDPQESMQRAVQFISMASFNSIPHSTSGNLVNEFVIKHQPQTMPIMMPSMAPTRAAMSSSFGGSSVSSVSENLRYTEGQDRISPELITPSPEFDIDAALRGDPFGSTGVFPIPPGNNMGTNGSFPIKNSVMMDKLGKLQDFRVGPLTTLKRDSSNSSIRSCNSSPDTKGQHVCQFPTCGRHFKRQDQLFRHVRSHSTSATESRHKRQNSHGSQGSFLDYSDTESVDSLPVRFTYGTNIAANQNNASMIVNNTYHQPSPLVMNSVPMMMNSTPVIMKGSVASKHPGSTIVMGKSAMLMGNGSMLMHQNTNIPMKNDPSIHSSPVPTQSGNTRSSSPNINLMHTQNDFMHDISAKNPDQSFMNSLIMASRPQQIQTMPLSYPANDSSTNQSLPTPTTMLVSSIIHEPDSAANFGSNFLTFDPNDLLHPFEALNNVCEPQAFFN